MKQIVLREELVSCCRLMAAKGLVAGTEGNVSARDKDGTILMTQSGVNKGDVEPEMLVRLNLEGNVLEGEFEPTSERFMHLEFYRQRPGVGGVAHGHPIFCTAFAAAHRPLPKNILPELIATIGEVVLVPYGRPSSSKLADALSPYCPKHNAFLLQNHGATTVEQVLGPLLDGGEQFDAEQVQSLIEPERPALPAVTITRPDLRLYDALLSEEVAS